MASSGDGTGLPFLSREVLQTISKQIRALATGTLLGTLLPSPKEGDVLSSKHLQELQRREKIDFKPLSRITSDKCVRWCMCLCVPMCMCVSDYMYMRVCACVHIANFYYFISFVASENLLGIFPKGRNGAVLCCSGFLGFLSLFGWPLGHPAGWHFQQELSGAASSCRSILSSGSQRCRASDPGTAGISWMFLLFPCC